MKNININLSKKINNIKNKSSNNKPVKIFIAPKVLAWSKYISDVIINCFSNKTIIYNPSEIKNVDIVITHIKQRTEYYSDSALNIVISGENYTTKYKYDISIATVKEFNSYYNIY